MARKVGKKNKVLGHGGKRKAPGNQKNIQGKSSGKPAPGLQGDIHGSGKKE